MRRLPGRVGLALIVVGLAWCSAATAGPGSGQSAAVHLVSAPEPATPASPMHRPLTDEQRIIHVLNRLAYGPRPGDVERVRKMGLRAWIDRQLHPEQVRDDSVEQALTAYPTLVMSTPQLIRAYPQPSREAKKDVRAGQMTKQELIEAYPPAKSPFRIISEMQAAKITRAVLSERQLQEVMVDFWFNHFNVLGSKGVVKWMLPSYERDAIRPHVLGHFRDMVLATAHHPAMLFYLDNRLSIRADVMKKSGGQKGKKMGLNENYARELMELHTLGVDGGYTQQDVVEVARAFTGWTVTTVKAGKSFIFKSAEHDPGEKRVLGQVIPAGGGEEDGLRVIDILARHPSTARFISTKLVRRFVSDDPPPSLVERATNTFRATDGDIRAVLATIFSSPEFFSEEAYRAKIKAPLEVVASAARALGADLAPPTTASSKREMERLDMDPISDKRKAQLGGLLQGGGISMARQVAILGEPLYQSQPPTGYADAAEAWVNTGALLHRMNFALALAHNQLPGVRVSLDQLLAGADRREPARVLDRLTDVVLHGQVTPETRAVLIAQLGNPAITRTTSNNRGGPEGTDIEKLTALVLGSPEFQRR